ncbi:MAG TPA: GNAT family N-acetyltransferase [Paucimonas sp.]|nr:GNAT family N-acetyltransferase [Paucimonas sp.]
MRPDITPSFHVRRFVEQDLPSLLRLMKALAEFEGYIADFRVTEHEIITRGWTDHPKFLGLVAQNSPSEDLIGMAIAYLVPFSYDLRPVAILKELYVEPGWRGGGVGKSLFNGVIDWARSEGCSKIRWDVLQENDAAKRFYRSLDGQPFTPWESWVLNMQST